MIELLLILALVVLVAWCAFTVGYVYRGYLISSAVQQVLSEIEQKNKDLIERLNSEDTFIVESALTDAAKDLNITLLKSEQVENQYFFYTKDTNQFVCQGRTLEEACKNYYEVNKTIGCIADPTNETDSYFIIEGKIQYKIDA